MKTWLTMCALMGLVALTALVASPAAAQQPAAATIRGRVLDPQHRGVAAQITVTQSRTGLERQTVADAAGYFALTSVPPDAVDLTVTAAGFAVQRMTGIQLEVGQTAEIEIVLQVAGVSERIAVAGDAGTVGVAASVVGAAV